MNDHRLSKTQPLSSPRWGNTTKLVIGLSFMAVMAGILIRFNYFVVPLLLAFILSYLLYPVANFLHRITRLPWRLAVTVIYLIALIVLFSVVIWGGLTLADQFQNMMGFAQGIIQDVTNFINKPAMPVVNFGPFHFDPRHLDMVVVGQQILNSFQPFLSGAGELVGTLASNAVATLGWLVFVLFISYFILAETEGVPGRMFDLHIPGYQIDTQRLMLELGRIWNAFLRGQIVLMGMIYLIYVVILGVLGIQFYYFLALLAAMARLVPYVGPTIAWTTFGLVAYTQLYNPFGMTPGSFVVMVLAICWVSDSIIDNIISPRILANALHVHPAALMVAALMAASLLGVVGMILAAPVLATLMLFSKYALRKMMDLDPWEGMRISSRRVSFTRRIIDNWLMLRDWVQDRLSVIGLKNKKEEKHDDQPA